MQSYSHTLDAECSFYFCKYLTFVCLCPQLAQKEEFEQQLKDLEEVCMPIVTPLYQGADGAENMPGGMPGGGFPDAGGDGGGQGGNGFIIEEVD